MRIQSTAALFSLLLAAGTASAQSKDFLIDDVVGALTWRSLGPARFGGRVVDIAVHPEKSRIFYVATGSGGLFKTENNGITFRTSFQYESVISIGDVAIAPSKPDVVYIGTGEANNQRSSYWGKGVYKSVDGGRNWKNMGLAGTDHIGRVVVHPKNADIVYVAALGSLYRKNEDRGVYRSIDGGASWVKVKFISEDVGFVDIAMDPNDPKTLYAASYERRRRAGNFDGYGPGSAIWKTTDSGDTWKKMTSGLPDGEIGRIGLDTFNGENGTVVFACVENGNPRQGSDDTNTTGRRSRRGRSRTLGGQVYRTADGGETWKKLNDKPVGGSPGYYYGQIRVDPNDEKRIYLLGVPVTVTKDGGKTWSTAGARGVHVDHHALWIDPKNSKHLRLGNDGGMHTSYDRGAHWDHLNHLSMGQFYAITADMSDPYWIYGGTQDNGTWGVPIRGERGAVQNRHAAKIGGGDGFFVQVDPIDPNIVYSESQFGGISRQDLRTGERKRIKPRVERGSPRLRFNWSSPIQLSPHNHHTVYFGSQYLHKSTNRGDKWTTISPDLTSADEERIKGNVPHCTITTIAESPKKEGFIWVGTDDGKVWLTRNGGDRWVDLTDRFDEMPRSLWVSRIEASPSDADVAYVSFTGYREDIRDPFLYITTDGGERFRSISNDLPKEPINVVREHPRNKEVLFVGTEFGVFVSFNAGGNWITMQNDMPTVACHDLIVHPREQDLIVGTHGRGIYVMDIAPLEDLNATILASDFHVFPATNGVTQRRARDQGYIGNRTWSADQHGGSPVFSYYLGRDTSEQVTLKVLDATGRTLFTSRGSTKAGLHRVTWGGRGRGGRGSRGGRGGFAGFRGRLGGGASQPGNYALEVTHGDTVVRKVFKITGVATPARGGRAGEESDDEGDRRRIVR